MTNKNRTTATLHTPWLQNWCEGYYQEEWVQGGSESLILNGGKADGAGNVAQHPHTDSQEQRGHIQNRRVRLG